MKRKLSLLLLMLLLPLLNPSAYSEKIIPGGNTIGITVNSKGLLIVGFYKVNNEYNRGDPELKIGDYITKINGLSISNISEFTKSLENYRSSKTVNITYVRNNKEYESTIDLVEIDGVLKTGLYVKDSVTGIGTLSYIDPENNVYGALGHEIMENTSNTMVNIKDGKIFKNIVTSIDKSKDGYPGSKNAKFFENIKYGNIYKNSKYGIYGLLDKESLKTEALPIKRINEINLGKAYLRTVISKEEIKDYEIEITDINKENKLKSISFKITDSELLDKTGGVVQGMSGSPIIQDNHLIGVVTHVLVDDVAKGYGVSIITMLDEGDKLYKKISDENH